MVTAPEAASVPPVANVETTPLLGQIKEAAQEKFKASIEGAHEVTNHNEHDMFANASCGITNGSHSSSGSDHGANTGALGTPDNPHANGQEYVANGLPAAIHAPPPTGRKAIPCRFHFEKRCVHGETGDGCPFSHVLPWQPQPDPVYRGGHSRGPSMTSFGPAPMSTAGYNNGVTPAQPHYYTPQQSPIEWGYHPQAYGGAPATPNGNPQSPLTSGGPSQPSPTAPFHDYPYAPGGFTQPPYAPSYAYPYYMPPPAMYGGMPAQGNGSYPHQNGGIPPAQGEFAPPAGQAYASEYADMASASCPPSTQMLTSDFGEPGVISAPDADIGVAHVASQDMDHGPNTYHGANGMADTSIEATGGINPHLEHAGIGCQPFYAPGPPLPPSAMSYGPPNLHRGRGGPFSRGRGVFNGRGRSANGRPRYMTHDGISTLNESDDRPPRGPCSFFAQGVCCYGDKCSFGHVMPNGDDARDYNQDYRGVGGSETVGNIARHRQLPKSDTFNPHAVVGFAIWRDRQKEKEKVQKESIASGTVVQSMAQQARDSRPRSESAGVGTTDMRQKVDDLVQQRRDGGFPGRKHFPSHHGGHMNHARGMGMPRHAPTHSQQKIPNGDDFPALVTSSNSVTQLGNSIRSDADSLTSLSKSAIVESEAPIPSPTLPSPLSPSDNMTTSMASSSTSNVESVAASCDVVVPSIDQTATSTIHQARLVGSFASAAARAMSVPASRSTSSPNVTSPGPRSVAETA